MSKKMLIVDAHNMAYRAQYKFDLTTDTGMPSGVAYGFIYILASILRRFSVEDVRVVFDGGRSPLRLEVYPEYKQRKDVLGLDKEPFYEQIKDLRSALLHLGCRVYHKRHCEADDIIYEIHRKNPKVVKTILSSDKDFVPLIGPYTKLFNPFKDKIISHLNVEAEYGVARENFLDYLILKGDKSDNIPGVHGMGDVRIGNFLREHGSIRDFLDSGQTFYGRYNIAEVYERNLKLISLSWHFRNGRPMVKGVKGNFDPHRLRPFLHKYQITSFHTENFLKPFSSL
jgi:DNA polymerase I